MIEGMEGDGGSWDGIETLEADACIRDFSRTFGLLSSGWVLVDDKEGQCMFAAST